MADKSKCHCPNCQGSGHLQTDSGQVFPCATCEGSGKTSRPEVSPFDYVYDYVIPASGQIAIAVQILSFDFLLKWLLGYSATPTDKVQVTDNNGRQWSNAPIQLQNFAGSAQLPFPVQPNWLQAKNTTLTITVTGTPGHTGEIVLRGINLGDAPAAA